MVSIIWFVTQHPFSVAVKRGLREMLAVTHTAFNGTNTFAPQTAL